MIGAEFGMKCVCGGVVFALFHFSFYSANGIVFKRLLLECFDFL